MPYWSSQIHNMDAEMSLSQHSVAAKHFETKAESDRPLKTINIVRNHHKIFLTVLPLRQHIRDEDP